MNNKSFLILLFSMIIIVSCNRNSYKSGKNISQATGWKINSADGGFKLNSKYKGQINAPGMIFVQLNNMLGPFSWTKLRSQMQCMENIYSGLKKCMVKTKILEGFLRLLFLTP